MSKKKKKNDVLYEMDTSQLDKRYLDLIEEIQFMQADLKRAERKVKKKQKKNLKKGKSFYLVSEERLARQQLIYQMEGTNFFDRAIQTLGELQPVCVIIAQLIMTLIVAILSIDSVKYSIRPETMKKMHSLYGLARQVGGTPGRRR